MSERKTEEEKINEKRSFLQKMLGFRFTPSISAWKLAIALFLLIAIAYAVNGAGVIAKGNDLEVSGNATVQGKVGIGTTAPEFLLNVVSSGIALPVEISASNSGTGNSFGLLRLFRLSSIVNDQAGIIFSLQDTQPARQEYGYIAAKISASTSGSEAGDLLFSTTNAGVTRQERMRITSAGNVGIGTAAPARKLHIKDSAADDVLVVDSGDGITQRFSAVDLHDNGAAKWGIGKNPSGDFYIDQSGVGNAITILGSNRNVGIGTPSPSNKLHISASGIEQVRIEDSSVLNTASAGLRFNTGAGANWVIGKNPNGDTVNSNDFAIREQGVGNQLVVKSGGNVGIGTTTPTEKLDVNGRVKGTELCIGADCRNTWPAGGGGGGGWVDDVTTVRLETSTDKVGIGTSTPGSELHVQGQLKVNSTISDKLVLSGTQAGPHTIFLDNSKGIRFWDNVNGELMRITNTGNVGIGTTNPTTLLDVLSTGTWGATIRATNGGGIGGILIGSRATNKAAIQGIDGSGNNVDLTLQPTSGNVGIGTTGPQRMLHTVGSGNSGIRIEATSTGSPVLDFFRNSGDNRNWGIRVGDQTDTDFAIRQSNVAGGDPITVGTVRFYINENGNVGIGTTNPAEKLDVNGRVKGTELCIGADCRNTWPAGGAGGGSGWVDDGTAVRLETSTDKVGIGTSTPGSELEVVGQLKVNSSISDKIVLAGTQTGPHTIFLDNSKGIRFWDNVNSELMRITNTGNVGVGTTNPANNVGNGGSNLGAPSLHIKSTTAPSYVIADGSSEANFVLAQNDGSANARIAMLRIASGVAKFVSMNDNLGVRNDNILVMNLGSGNVGIGTASPSTKIDVEGNIECGIAGSADCTIQSAKGIALDTGGSLEPIRFITDIEKMRITGDGNVGIGTTNPAEKLDVNGRVKGTELCIGADCRNAWPAGGAGGGSGWVDDGTAVRLETSTDKVGIGTTNPLAPLSVVGTTRIQSSASGDWAGFDLTPGAGAGAPVVLSAQYVTTAPQLRLTASGSSNQLVLATDGNVGIGTTSPAAALHVAAASTQLSFSDNSAGEVRQWTFNANSNKLFIVDGTQGLERITIDINGNVGIGTTNPTANLHVKTGTDQNFRILGPSVFASGNRIQVLNDASATAPLELSANSFDFHNGGGVSILRLTNAGNVGIGTTIPAQKLDVVGQIHASGDVCTDAGGGKCLSTAGGGGGDTTPDTIADDGVISDAEASDALTINNGLLYAPTSGNVGVGTTSPAQKLEVAGGRIRVKKTGGTAGSAEIFVAVGDATPRSGNILCDSALGASNTNAVCLAHWNSAGAEATCSNARTDARALCAIFGD